MDEQKVDTVAQYRAFKAEKKRLRAELDEAISRAELALSELALEYLRGTTWELVIRDDVEACLKAFSYKWDMPDTVKTAAPALVELLEETFPHGTVYLYGPDGDTMVARLFCNDGRWSIGDNGEDTWTVAACLGFVTTYGIKLKNDPSGKDELLKRIKEQADIEETARANRVALEEKLKLCNDKEAS